MINMLLDFTGEFGPIILFGITVFLLRFKTNLLVYYCAGMLLKAVLNALLKVIIQAPRPMEDPQLFNSMLQYSRLHRPFYQLPYDRYGMPSGHSSSVFYSTMFVHLAFQDVRTTSFYLLISFITLFQRVNNLFHSIPQVMAGTLLGILVGWGSFYMATQNKMGSLRQKPDDFAPMFN